MVKIYREARQPTVHGVHVMLLAVVVLLGFATVTQSVARPPLASSETRFVEVSENGMHIVPASCPSTPHYGGECSPENNSSNCIITAEPAVLLPGQSTTITWSTTCSWYQGCFASMYKFGKIDDMDGTLWDNVPMSGSRVLTPTKSEMLVYSGEFGNQILSLPFHCSTWPMVCQPGETIVDGHCVAQQCTPSYSCSGNGILNSCTNTVTPCTGGQICQNAQCVCPAGYTLSGGQCVTSQCPIGYVLNNDQCVFVSCPGGYTLEDGVCVNNSQCGAQSQYFCSDATHACYGNPNPSCGASCQFCRYGCLSGKCSPPPKPTGTLKVSPLLVHRGDTSTVTWTAKYVTSCVVTSNNGDNWSDTASASTDSISQSATSKSIRNQTIFTMNCNGLDGSGITLSQTVNILPAFEETCNPGFIHVNGVCVQQ